MDKRIEDLEVRFAFQEESIDALNRQQHLQQKEIDTLQREVARLKQLLQQSGSGNDIIDEPPPHY
ncbi:MAG: SlyX family protein [Candidatus Polarisedimenticolaceae bacterium]|nr:SlyX family protein [Candidatus Polarisedimenticolaceae bacterium]